MMPQVDLDAIFNHLGRDYAQQIVARDSHAKGSAEWSRFDQGRWAFREAALTVNRAAGYSSDVYGAWLDEWTPEASGR